jgi:hypothetical protein
VIAAAGVLVRMVITWSLQRVDSLIKMFQEELQRMHTEREKMNEHMAENARAWVDAVKDYVAAYKSNVEVQNEMLSILKRMNGKKEE